MRPALAGGHTLIEMLIVIAVLGVLLGLAARNYRPWIANSQIRTAAETLVEGLNTARNEAIRRNRTIDFRLVSDLSETCVASDTGSSWVVSEGDPQGKCDHDISESVEPMIVAKKSAAERTATVTLAGRSASDTPASLISFNGVGRVVVSGRTPIARIDVDSSAVIGEQSRDLRIVLSIGGMIRMCDPDPKVASGDTRKCP